MRRILCVGCNRSKARCVHAHQRRGQDKRPFFGQTLTLSSPGIALNIDPFVCVGTSVLGCVAAFARTRRNGERLV